MLEDELLKYTQSGIYPFHMPGHKRNPKFRAVSDALAVDVTELDETDDLHCAETILNEVMQKASATFGAYKTFLSVGGSTAGILAGVASMTREGDAAVVACNCHKSVYNALCLCRIEPIFICPQTAENFDFCLSVDPDSVKRAFENNKDKKISLVIVTSPTYEGVISDISAIAEIAHSFGATLLVDEAHGAHLGFHKDFAPSSVSCGADLCVQSLHKTLPCFTQTALVHICRENNELAEKTAEKLAVFESSSPSYILMCGIDYCVSLLSENARELFSAYKSRLDKFSLSCRNLKNISIFGLTDADRANPSIFAKDSSKIVISSNKISGERLYYILKDEYKLQLEMFGANYVLAVTSICDTDEGFERLANALAAVDKSLDGAPDLQRPRFCAGSTLPVMGLLPADAANADSEFVPLEKSEGRICTGMVYAYPPAVPVIFCGEIVSRKKIALVSAMLDSKISVQGSALKAKSLRVKKSSY